MDIELIRSFMGRKVAGISASDGRIYEDKISGQHFDNEQAALDSIVASYQQADGQPNHRLADLQNRFRANQ